MAKKNKQVPRNDLQYEQLASEYLIKATPKLDEYSLVAHNLYNRALFDLRQGFFKKKYIKGYSQLDQIFKERYQKRELMLYHSLGYVQSAQQTLREVTTVWQSFFKALKAYKANPSKFSGKPRLPRYLRDKRHTFFVTNQNAKVKDGYLIVPKLDLKLKLAPNIEKIGRVAFKPVANGYKVIVPYKANKEIKYLPDNGKYIGIDPGIDNAFACASNTGNRPLLINGRGIKSVNQYYNKKRAELRQLQARYHQLERIINTKQGKKVVYQDTQAMKKITAWRNDKIRQFAHKASKRIVDYALSCEANTIVIGKNKSWKRSSNIGKRNNQNFVGIPHQVMIDMIKYKANLAGITVIQTNESYTSQTSSLDHEQPCWENGNKSRKRQGKSPVNRRIKRGLFKANDDRLINADINGALQIIRKVFSNFQVNDEIAGVVLRPVKWSPKF